MKKLLIEIFRLTEETFTGFAIAGLYDVIIKEGIHAVFVLITGVITTIVIHYTKKFLNKNDNSERVS